MGRMWPLCTIIMGALIAVLAAGVWQGEAQQLATGDLAALQTPLAVVINEVAWAGHSGLASDEWIELYNTCLLYTS
ncbi:MAG: hypothetical protein N2508_15285, partial [Anaerolineae bacterium]|nr:hypothetical protein [Anaerolineae bacterium]